MAKSSSRPLSSASTKSAAGSAAPAGSKGSERPTPRSSASASSSRSTRVERPTRDVPAATSTRTDVPRTTERTSAPAQAKGAAAPVGARGAEGPRRGVKVVAQANVKPGAAKGTRESGSGGASARETMPAASALATSGGPTRTEKDTMGEMAVPADVLYGASTQRAVLNFPVSGRPVPEGIIKAYALIKGACATVNNGLGRLDDGRTRAILEACREIADGLASFGGLSRHFPVDVFQTGSGTSTNMNANEVIANLVCVRAHKPIGLSKDPAWIKAGGVHPNDHVNMGQSSNDTFPTAMHVAAALAIKNDLLPAVQAMAEDLEDKARRWDEIVKIGRTHLQDATPIRLGQEFSGYASQMRHSEERLHRALHTLSELAIGGTAVGTGINAHEQFGALVAAELSQRTEIHFREAQNHFEAQHAKDAFVEASSHLATIAVSLTKIANDIRWLGSGPRCGIGELILPPVQPGSSIMPGKVNPVICESLVMVCCQVIGNDQATRLGGLGGVGSLLDLNVAMPMMAANVLDSIHLLSRGINMFVANLLAGPDMPASVAPGPNGSKSPGLQPDEKRCAALIEGSLAMCTSLVPVIGYDASAALAKEAYKQGKTVRQLAHETVVGKPNLTPGAGNKPITKADLDAALDPWSMTLPGGEGSAGG